MPFKILIFLCISLNMYATGAMDINVKVLDEKGQALTGVIIYSDDYAISSYTDENGWAQINNVKHNDYLNFSYLGYITRRLRVREIHALKYKIQLEPQPEILEQVIVVGRKDTPIEDILFETKIIKAKDIQLLNSASSADILTQTGSVYVQKTQLGGGSPVLRGFEANKVLLVIDGVRLNNAIYRNGHLQNAITIDNNILDRAEVILGPGALNYGSDAMGGVVHYRTKDPIFNMNIKDKANIKSNLSLNYASASTEKKAHFDVNYGLKKFASLTSITYVDFDDLRGGNNRPNKYPNYGKQFFYVKRLENQDLFFPNEDPNVQVGTGYSQLDILQKFKLTLGDTKYVVANLQYSTSSNLPRYDKITDTISSGNDFKYAEYYYGPQQRFLTSIKYRNLSQTKYYDNATYIVAYQRITEDRYFRKFGNARRFFNIENVNIGSFTADFQKNLKEETPLILEYGLDINYNKVTSEAGKIHISSNVIDRSHLTRYPSGGSHMTMLGIYGNIKQSILANKGELYAGLRYNYAGLKAKYLETDLIEWPEYFYNAVKLKNSALTGVLGFKLNSPNGFGLDAIASTAFRSPNIDDFGKIREKNGYVTIPNADLKPEKSLNSELSLKYKFGDNKRSNLGVTGFYTYLYDAIVRENFTLPNGDSILIYANEPRVIQSNINANRAFIIGGSFYTKIKMGEKLSFNGAINYTKGRKYDQDTTTLTPLSHIPPVFGKIELVFKKKNFRLLSNIILNGAKTRAQYGGSEDNLEEATIDGTPAWHTINFYGQFNITSTLKLNLAFENILDVQYRPFASGISAPGRNFMIGFRKNWE